MQRKRHSGFTLVELMIAVAILGILTAIAIPNYQNSITKSRRAGAKAALLDLSSFMERLYTETGCYNPGPNRLCEGNTGDDAAPTLPYDKTYAGSQTYYNITVVATDTTYTLSATPVLSDSGCGGLTPLTYSNNGQKTPTTDGCW